MNRDSHGMTNAVTHLQSSLTAIIPEDLRQNVLIWLDDILTYAETVGRLQEGNAAFFKLCVDYNIKSHPAKCIFFAGVIR